MKQRIRAYISFLALSMLVFNMIPHKVSAASNNELIYPLKQISKLECRFEEFDTLSSNCKQDLPILKTKDYSKYAVKNDWYNDYTRLYTVLWGSSYKYGWDVWNGGHQWTDIATAKWTPVYTIADGKVITVWNDAGWGKHVSVEHTIKGTKVISNYAHLSKITVNKGEKIEVGEKIGEVWSTGNSTWNHLHFQIDLPSTFHPYYYDWNACPFSYYEITEKWVCFDELKKHTFDPLAFLESNGWIIDEVSISSSSSTTSKVSSSTNSSVSTSSSVFNTTVYYGYGSESDVRAVQRIYKDLGYYDGKINWDFEDVEQSIIDYQLASGVLSSRSDDGAWWFGPKTRAQTKIDYEDYENNKPTRKVWFEEGEEVIVTQNVEKVERANLMTREEREAQEMAEFLKTYNIDIENSPSQLQVGQSETSLFTIQNRKGKWFKWNTPGSVNFKYDSSKISIFPETFFNFRDGEREIEVTWKSSGHTTVEVRIGEVIVDTFSVTVGKSWQKPWVQSANIYTDKSATLWEEKRWVVLMKDGYSNKLVKTKYSGSFTLSSDDNVEYCVKRWKLKDIKEIYQRDCFADEYTSKVEFDYSDTIEGLLIFNYRALDDRADLEVKTTSGKSLTTKSVAVTHPKNLKTSYAYYDEVMTTLMSWVTDGIDRWYFLEDRELTKYDAKRWLLSAMEENGASEQEKKYLQEIEMSKYEKVTRKEFLILAYTYLWDDWDTWYAQVAEYKDMEEEDEKLVGAVLWNNYKWKDNFWEKYFQPDKRITRGEAAYMLTQTLEMKANGLVVRN